MENCSSPPVTKIIHINCYEYELKALCLHGKPSTSCFKGTEFQCYKKFTSVKIFFLIYLLYLFIFGCVGSSLLRTGFLQLWWVGTTLPCGVWASHCSGFSCCGARALGARASVVVHVGSVVVAHGLYSAGPVVVAHRLSCFAACGIFPDQGLNPCPLHWQADP